MHQIFFKFPAEYMGHAVLAKKRLVQRRIETIGNQTRGWLNHANAIDDGKRKSCGRVHGEKKPHDLRISNHIVHELLFGKVQARDFHARFDQPRGRGRQAEWLASHVVRRDEQNPHESLYVLTSG